MDKGLRAEQLYENYRVKVERYVNSHVYNKEDVNDIVSEVFVKVLSKMDTYDEKKAAIGTWIYTITKNTVCDYYRKHGKTIPCDNLEYIGGETVAADENLLREEELAGLAKALEKLSQRERDLLILRFYHEISPIEIAEKMNLSYSNVRYIQSTALRKLRKYLPS
ncbi:MAG: sigma-70 family RNA polymerase sigma factor [Lachnospiraceae bacterium]